MAYHPVPDGLKSASSTIGESGTPGDVPHSADGSGANSNLTELAARFATQSGGGLSPKLSADLALEIVLNEFADQACLATGATGAAIVLKGDSEMVCRASSGSTAPALGARFDAASGLSGLCIATSRVQRCDDAQTDVNADAEACNRLGVRSVMVLPLMRDAEVVGLFELLSSRPAAFGDRDELTLKALSHRVLKNLELAAEPFAEPVDVPRAIYPTELVDPIVDHSQADAESDHQMRHALRHPWFAPSSAPLLVEETSDTPSGLGLDVVTGILGAAVLAGAILLAVLIGQRMGGHNSGRSVVPRRAQTEESVLSKGHGAQRSSEKNSAQITAPKGLAGTKQTSAPGGFTGGHAVDASIRKDAVPQPRKPALLPSSDSSLSEGGLRIYENGREIFRMPPDGAQADSPGRTAGTGVRRASAIESSPIVELSPTEAEGNVVHRVEPDYPEEARQQQLQGSVVMDVRISRDGKVQSVNVVSGQHLLADAAIAAVKMWRFNPRTVKGKPAEMQTTVTMNFRLPSQPKM